MMANYWIVDPRQEGGGGWTVRVDDGSSCGDINQDPVATFNRREDADSCVLVRRTVCDAEIALQQALDLLKEIWVDQNDLKPEIRNNDALDRIGAFLKENGR